MYSLEEKEWEELKGLCMERRGRFLPKHLIKYAQKETNKTDRLNEICSRWLLENFHINAEIEELEVLEQEEIDRNLGLIGIKFSFSNDEGVEGDSVAFIDTEEVRTIG